MFTAKWKRLNDAVPIAYLPRFAHPDDLGMDLHVFGDHTLNPGESRDLPSGWAVEMPPGYGCRITGRSSSLRSRGIFVNEGIIDPGYRGELKTYITNRNAVAVTIEDGTRLAQVIPVARVMMDSIIVGELAESARGTAGFGSTGTAGYGNGQTPAESTGSPRGVSPSPSLYLGGPIDSVAPDAFSETHDWRHAQFWHGLEGLRSYCPICECKGLAHWQLVLHQNTRALREATFAVFDLRLEHQSVGTPIEAWQRIQENPLTTIIVGKAAGVFLEAMEAAGASIVATFEDAGAMLRGWYPSPGRRR